MEKSLLLRLKHAILGWLKPSSGGKILMLLYVLKHVTLVRLKHHPRTKN